MPYNIFPRHLFDRFPFKRIPYNSFVNSIANQYRYAKIATLMLHTLHPVTQG